MKNKRLLWLMLLLLVGAGIAMTVAWYKNRGPALAVAPEPPQVHAKEPGVLRFPNGASQLSLLSVEPLVVFPVPLAEPLNARIVFDENATARVSAPIAGRVVELRTLLGDEVKAGAALAVIDAPDLGAAQADLLKARADENRKALALRRARELAEGGVLSRRELESVEADQAQAHAEVERAALRLANLNPRGGNLLGQRMTLTTPIAGVVVDRKANPGMEVRPDLADPLFIVTDLRRLQVLVDLPEAHIGKVRVGQEVSVEVDAWKDEKFPGTVERIAPAVDPTTRRLQVRCKVDNKLLRLRPEMYARVSLLAEARRSAGRIPNAALVSDGLYSFVFIERETGVFEKRKVTLEVQDREFSYVSEGIKEGERVVVRGALLLASELASGS